MKTFKFLSVAGVSFLLSISFVMPVYANVSGKALRVKGKVSSLSSAGTKEIKRGSKISQNETVTTGAASSAQFRMVDGALFSLRQNSQWKVSTYVAKSKGVEGSVKMDLLKGGLRTITGEVGKQNKKNYQLNTPVASIGIRGTHYQVELLKGEAYIAVWDGQIKIDALNCGLLLDNKKIGVKVRLDGSCEDLVEWPQNFNLIEFAEDTKLVKTVLEDLPPTNNQQPESPESPTLRPRQGEQQETLDSPELIDDDVYDDDEDPLIDSDGNCEDHVCFPEDGALIINIII